MVDLTDLNTYWPIATSVLTTFVSQGALKGPMQSLSYMWYSKFGHKAEKAAKLAELRNSVFYDQEKKALENQQEFLTQTDTEISKIDPINLTAPISYIAGPAIEQSDYYIDEPELRSMFAKLIASSMDSTKITIIHSSYSQIIKELTPLDARIFQSLHVDDNNIVGRIKLHIEGGTGYKNLFSHIYLGYASSSDSKLIAPSLDNLQRLGLISVEYGIYATKEGAYDIFTDTYEYKQAQEMIEERKRQKEFFLLLYKDKKDSDINTYSHCEIEKGLIKVTEFGKNFLSICID